MDEIEVNPNGTNTLKRCLRALGWAVLVALILCALRVALGLYAYHAQGFPMPVKDYMSNDTMSVPGFLGSPSTDTTTVSITLNHTTKLHIPRNYLFDAASVNPWPDMRITIMTTFPGFQGVDASTIDQARSRQWYDQGNLITIRRNSKPSAYLDWNKPWMDKIAREVGPLDTNPELHNQMGSDLIVKYRGSEEHSLLIQCPSPRTDALTCNVYADVAPGFTVIYQFRPSLLPHWQEIDDGVMKLLNSFVVH